MRLVRYSRWDGTQEVFPIDEDDLMEQLSDQLMRQGDLSAALRSLFQRGFHSADGQHLSGLQDMVQNLRHRRQQLLDRYDLDSVMEGMREKLQEIQRLEREGMEQRLDQAQAQLHELEDQGQSDSLEARLLQRLQRLANTNLEFLDNLPEGPAGAIAQLQNYEFMNPAAKEQFDELLRSLQQQALNSYLQQMSQGLQRLTASDLQAMKEMTSALNRMLEERAQGGQPNYQDFLQKYGHLFGSQPPATLDQLVEQLQEQMASTQSLLESMSPEQQGQLQAALNAALQDPALLDQLSQLAANLERLNPMGSRLHSYPFAGSDPLDMDGAMNVMEQLRDMEKMERQLRRIHHGGSLEDIDQELLRQLLGDDAAQDLERLGKLTNALEDAGYIRRDGARIELTPRGMQKIGQKALKEIFSAMKKDRLGQHPVEQRGPGAERLEETKRYEFGDAVDLDIKKTLFNALEREGRSVPLRVLPEDFEVVRSGKTVRSSTVLLVDLSLSMAMRGNFIAAKKVALALDNLIRTQFPQDSLYIVGFSTRAQELKPEKLAYLAWDEFEPYTNIQHGLIVAQKLLARVPGGSKQVIMISDGEPTAHVEGGQLFLQYPPSPRTIRETLQEVKRCTSKGILINTFMLDHNASLAEFVDQMTRINRGRVFYTSPDRLGQYVLVDYFASRRRVLS